MEIAAPGMFILLATALGALAGSATRTRGAIAAPMTIVAGLAIFVLSGTVLLVIGSPTTPVLVAVASLLVTALIRWLLPPVAPSTVPWRALVLGGAALTAAAGAVAMTVAEVVSEDSFDNTNLAGLLAMGRGDAARNFTLLLRPPALALLHGPSIMMGGQFSAWVAPLLLLLLVWLLVAIVWEEMGPAERVARPFVVSGIVLLLASLPMFALNLTYISAHAMTGLYLLVGGWSASSALRGRHENVPELGLALAMLTVVRTDGPFYGVLLVLPLLVSVVPWGVVRGALRAWGLAAALWFGFLALRASNGDATLRGTPYETTLALGVVGLLAVGVSFATAGSFLDRWRCRLRPAVELLPLVLIAIAWGASDEGLRFVGRRLGAALIAGQGGWTLAPIVLLGLVLVTAGTRGSLENWNLRFLVTTAPLMLIALRVIEGLDEGSFERFVWMEPLSRATLHLLPAALLLVVLALRREAPTGPVPESFERRPKFVATSSLVAGLAAAAAMASTSGLGLLQERPDWLPDLGPIESELASRERVLIVQGPSLPLEVQRAVVLASDGRAELIAADEVASALREAREAEEAPLVVMPACSSGQWGRELLLSSIAVEGRIYRWVARLPDSPPEPLPVDVDVLLPYTGADRSHGILWWIGTELGRRSFYCNPVALGLVHSSATSVMAPSTVDGPLSHRSLRGLVDGWDWQEILHTLNGDEEQFSVDLRRDVVVEGVTVSQRTHSADHLVRRFVIDGSRDGLEWERVVTGQHAGGPGESQYFNADDARTGPWRMLRLRLDGLNSSGDRYLVLGEFELYGAILGDSRAVPDVGSK